MADLKTLDRAFDLIVRHIVDTGVAPHYTELAAQLGVSPGQGREAIQDLIGAGYPAWFHPDTDWLASFPPFSNIPTQYRIAVEGEQRWYAQ